MSEPLGVERIVVLPDTTAFRAELEAQVAAALTSVQAQVRAINIPAAASAVAQATAPAAAAAVVRPPAPPPPPPATPPDVAAVSERSLQTTRAQVAAQEELAAATAQTAAAQTRAAAATSAASQRGLAGTQAAVGAQERLTAAARQTAAAVTTAGGVVLPESARSLAATEAQVTAQQELATVTSQTAAAQTRGATAAATASARGLTAVQAEISAQERLAAVAASARAATTAGGGVLLAPQPQPAAPVSAGGVVLPGSARNLAATQAAVQAQEELVASTGRVVVAQRAAAPAIQETATRTTGLAGANTRAATSMTQMNRSVQNAETSLGRLTRGTVAASAASSGLFRAVSFASGAFLVGALAGGTLAAGIQEFAESTTVGAQTVALIKSTGGAANVTAEQVEKLATAQEHLTGVDNELVQRSQNVLLTFKGIRDEVGAGNQIFTRATGAVQDISTVLGTSLRSTSIQVGKALQDPVRGITALRRAGIGFTSDQRKLITQLVETGRTLDAQKLILAEIERQVGGTAQAVGRTLPGRLNILKESARDALGDYVERLQDSRDAEELAAAGAGALSSAFDTVKTTLSTIGPQLVGVGEGLGRVTSSIGGAGTLLAVAVGYKAVGAATRVASAGQALYAATAATAAQAALEEAAASGAVTATLERQAAAETAAAASARRRFGAIGLVTGALAVGSAASGQYTSALLLGTAAAGSFALKGLAAARAAQAGGAAFFGLRAGLAALTGGPLGIAAVGLGAVAAAIYLIHRRSGQAAGSIRGFQGALEPLVSLLERLEKLRSDVAANQENVTLAGLDVTQANRQVAAARAALARSAAPVGSIEQAGLSAALAQALDKQRGAVANLRREEEKLLQSQRDRDAAERERPTTITRQTAALRAQIAALRERAGITTLPRQEQAVGLDNAARAARLRADENRRLAAQQPTNLRGPFLKRAAEEDRQAAQIEAQAAEIRRNAQRETAPNAVAAANSLLRNLENTGKAAERAFAQPLRGIVQQLDRLPTAKETRLVLRMVGEGASVDEIFKALGLRPLPAPAGGAGSANAVAIQRLQQARALVRAQRLLLAPLQEEQAKRRDLLRTAQDQVKAAQDSVAAAHDQVASAREGVVAAREQIVSSQRSVVAAREQAGAARQSLQDAREQAALSRQNLRDTIQQAKLAVAQAVNDAKGNLNQLAEAIGQTLNQVATSLSRRGDLGEAFRRTREQILRSRGPEAQGAQQTLGFRVNARTSATDSTDFVKQLTNLTNAFNFRRIKAPQFIREFDKIIAAVDPAKLRAKLGGLATDTLLAQVAGVRRQVPLIQRAPLVPGGGVAATVVNPAEAQEAAAKQIAGAQRDLRGAIRGIADAQHGVRDALVGVEDSIRDVARARAGLVTAERSRERADRELLAAQRRLSAAEVRSRKRNSDVIEQHRLVMQQLVKVTAAENRLARRKPGGTANDTATALTSRQTARSTE